ncbi:MAG: DUF2188 domain-containing protein [Veillonellaceae bacterium]|nr:DUF2188 domain-containing protein [Veillonellaceae bacterium]
MPNQHVTKRDNGWAVKAEGSKKATVIKKTQAEAIAVAREISRNQKTELFIHGTDGKIRARDSHGHDPYPPKW